MKSLVFICKNIPNLIKSGGDVRALRMIKILREEYNVTVLATSADYGEGDVKKLGCISHWNGNLETLIKQYVGKNADLIIISGWGIAKNTIDLIRTLTSCKIIIDSIDVEFLRLQRKFEYCKGINISKEQVEKAKKNELDTYKKADAVIIVSKRDAQELMYYSFKLIELPCLFEVNFTNMVDNKRNGYIICNWSHEPNIASTIYLCEKILPKVNVNFYIVGKHPPEQIKKFASNQITIRGAEYEINKFLNNMNICLAPVFYAAGMNSKIGEALAFGIPVITTTMGAEPYNLTHLETAMVADDDESFITAINKVLDNDDLRLKLSSNGRVLMQNYTVDCWKKSFLEAL